MSKTTVKTCKISAPGVPNSAAELGISLRLRLLSATSSLRNQHLIVLDLGILVRSAHGKMGERGEHLDYSIQLYSSYSKLLFKNVLDESTWRQIKLFKIHVIRVYKANYSRIPNLDHAWKPVDPQTGFSDRSCGNLYPPMVSTRTP